MLSTRSNHRDLSAAQRYPTRTFLLKAAVTVLLLLVLFARVDFSAVFSAAGGLSAATVMSGVMLYLAAGAIAALKWKLLLQPHSFLRLLRLTFIAQYYSLVLPGQLAGELVKTYQLARGKADAERIAASVFIDRITGFLGLLAIALSGTFLSRSIIAPHIVWTLVVFSIVLLVALFCIQVPAWLRLLRTFSGRFGGLGARAMKIVDAWKAYLASPLLLAVSTGVGACYQLVAIWINILFARELGISIEFADWCWLFGIVSIVTMLPFTLGGVGLREGSFVGALALFDVRAEQALALSLMIFGLMMLGALIGAALAWTGGSAGTPHGAAAATAPR